MKGKGSLLSIAWLAVLAGCQTLEQDAAVQERHLGQREVFTSADKNADGVLSVHEVATYHHEEDLQEYDLDNDNHISQAEWSAAHAGMADSDEHFNNIDKDKNGHISKDEAVLYVTEHVSFHNMVKEHDDDGDYQLRWEEMDGAAPTELDITIFSLHPKV